MNLPAHGVTEAAKQDFRLVLRDTRERSGERQREIYKTLIASAVDMVAAVPCLGGSWHRGGILPGLRAFHLEHAAGRRGTAAHILYYAVDPSPVGAGLVVILRLLHEGMEPRLHIARTGWDRPL